MVSFSSYVQMGNLEYKYHNMYGDLKLIVLGIEINISHMSFNKKNSKLYFICGFLVALDLPAQYNPSQHETYQI